jgi:hypothetical protein
VDMCSGRDGQSPAIRCEALLIRVTETAGMDNKKLSSVTGILKVPHLIQKADNRESTYTFYVFC